MILSRRVRPFVLGLAVLVPAACGGGNNDSGQQPAQTTAANAQLVDLLAELGLDRDCIEQQLTSLSAADARLLVESFDSPDVPEGLSAAGETVLAGLEACGSARAPDTSAEPPAESHTETTPAPARSGSTYTATDICEAIDPAVVADVMSAGGAAVQRSDDTYCNLAVDLEGFGNSLNISVQPAIVPDPMELFESTVSGRVIIAGGDVEPAPVDGIGDRAVVIPTPQGNVIVALVGDTVVAFDPMLASGDVTVEQWQAILGPALARL